MPKHIQQSFNPISFGLKWKGEDSYEFDREKATKAAKEARSKRAKELRKEGYKVKLFTLRNQLMSPNSIGSMGWQKHPDIEIVTNAYMLDAEK